MWGFMVRKYALILTTHTRTRFTLIIIYNFILPNPYQKIKKKIKRAKIGSFLLHF